MLEWHTKLVQKISRRNLNFIILGKILAVFALGGLFSRHLIAYGLYLLLGSFILLFSFFSTFGLNWYHKEKVTMATFFTGFLGLFIFSLFVGMQASSVPFREYILIFGIILTLPGLYEVIFK